MNRIWAPEIHFINNKWYIYFAADNGDNKNHRMNVLESNSQDALGTYKYMGTLDTEGWAMYAIIETILTLLSSLLWHTFKKTIYKEPFCFTLVIQLGLDIREPLGTNKFFPLYRNSLI